VRIPAIERMGRASPGVPARASYLAAACFIVGLAVAAFAVYGFNERLASVLREELSASVMTSLAQAEINIKAPVENVKDLSKVLMENPTLRRALERPVDAKDRLGEIKDYQQLSRILESAQNDRYIGRVRLFVDPRLSYSREHVNFFALGAALEQAPYATAFKDDAGIGIIATHDEGYIGKGPMRVITLFRPIGLDETSAAGFPVLAIDLPERIFGGILERLRFPHDGRAYLVDPDGRVLSSADPSEIGKSFAGLSPLPLSQESVARAFAAESGMAEVGPPGRRAVLVHKAVEGTNWRLVTLIDVGAAIGRTRSYGYMTTIASAAAIAVLILVIALSLEAAVNASTSRKIREITRQIAEGGEPYFEGRPKGDLSALEGSVDALLATSRRLMAESYGLREREHEARLSALQAQINPHFLYNTLDTLNWMAARRGAKDISDMVVSLAKYFRIALSRGDEIITIAEELELTKAYLAVQNARFGGSFEAVFDVDAALLGYAIPKLTVQPLVENALLHGLQQKRGGAGRLEVGASVAGGDIEISVRDDGPGIPPAELEALKGRIDAGSSEGEGGYGLVNVNERLRLFCGSGCGVSLSSREGEWTLATIRLRPSAVPPRA
jgi:two-component system, sensor histidine kinase YesM